MDSEGQLASQLDVVWRRGDVTHKNARTIFTPHENQREGNRGGTKVASPTGLEPEAHLTPIRSNDAYLPDIASSDSASAAPDATG